MKGNRLGQYRNQPAGVGILLALGLAAFANPGALEADSGPPAPYPRHAAIGQANPQAGLPASTWALIGAGLSIILWRGKQGGAAARNNRRRQAS
jgi:hypothetical protein